MPGETISAATSSQAVARVRSVSAKPASSALVRASGLSSQRQGSAPPAISARAVASPDRPRPRTATFLPSYPLTGIMPPPMHLAPATMPCPSRARKDPGFTPAPIRSRVGARENPRETRPQKFIPDIPKGRHDPGKNGRQGKHSLSRHAGRRHPVRQFRRARPAGIHSGIRPNHPRPRQGAAGHGGRRQEIRACARRRSLRSAQSRRPSGHPAWSDPG